MDTQSDYTIVFYAFDRFFRNMAKMELTIRCVEAVFSDAADRRCFSQIRQIIGAFNNTRLGKPQEHNACQWSRCLRAMRAYAASKCPHGNDLLGKQTAESGVRRDHARTLG
jgi:hypothetical protein